QIDALTQETVALRRISQDRYFARRGADELSSLRANGLLASLQNRTVLVRILGHDAPVALHSIEHWSRSGAQRPGVQIGEPILDPQLAPHLIPISLVQVRTRP